VDCGEHSTTRVVGAFLCPQGVCMTPTLSTVEFLRVETVWTNVILSSAVV
jgi:hypothetical protein